MPEDAYLGNGNVDGWIGDSDDYTPYYADTYESDIPVKNDKDWYFTPSGHKCPWCKDGLESSFEPEDDDDARMSLCRGHAAEFMGLSLDGLDRMESELAYDQL